MKNNFNGKKQSINTNDNDTFYVMLNEMVHNYNPKTKLPVNFLEKVLKEYSPIEEGDTIIKGTLNDWGRFIGYIIDQYESL